MIKERTYFCIDMKSFYASVECVERGLNPMETNLVVADEQRGQGAICLAISPKLKALGVKNRCRLFEIPKGLDYIIAKPRMKKYIEYAADIYSVFLDYVSKDDIHVYSIDESFIDATDYLKLYRLTAKEFAVKLLNEIAKIKHIPATCGIGTNMYLAKIALDITAKHVSDHIGYLNEELYKQTLWKHRPLSDFWQISKGISSRLAKLGIYDMESLATCPENLLYKQFGINAELLIDHANGRESCTIADIKAYKGETKSVSSSQILFEDYPYEKARLVIKEMALNGCQEMMSRGLIAYKLGISVGYSKDCRPVSGGSVRMVQNTAVYSIIEKYVIDLFDSTTDKNFPIRRLAIFFSVLDECAEGYDIFTDYEAIEKEKKAEMAVLDVKSKFGKNAVIRAMDLQEGATAQIRNKLVGGHNGE